MNLYNETYEIKLIKSRKFEEFRKLKGFNDKKIFASEYSFIQYCKSLNLGLLLGIKQNTKCLFHPDNSSSASIFKNNITGDFVYKCHSSKCNSPRRTTNIFGVIEGVLDCNFSVAVKYLKQMLNCEVQSNTSNHNTIGEHNVKLLEECRDKFPIMFKIIGKDIELLKFTYEETAKNKYISKDADNVVFSVSTRYLEKQLGKNCKVANKLAIFMYLGLIEKIGLQGVSISRYNNTLKKFNTITNIKVKRLNETDLQNGEKMAESWFDKGYKKREFTYKTVCEKDDVFLANRLFSQHK